MNAKLDRETTKPDKVKDNNARCIYCRKCYNSGLCMMPWPGLPVSKSKEAFTRGSGNQQEVKDQRE
jgi:hypothetical protein